MSRTKERKKITHTPSTLEVFHSLASCSEWVELLLNEDHAYNSFIEGLIKNSFFKTEEERFTIKKLASKLGYPTPKITKWITMMYEDIINLNWDKPQLFRKDGIKHSLHFQNYDNYISLILWLKTTPREFETFSSPFLKAKMGTSSFCITSVMHEFEDCEHNIEIILKGGFSNRYRSMLLERAKFFGHIGLIETFNDYDFQIDEKLQNIYKSERF